MTQNVSKTGFLCLILACLFSFSAVSSHAGGRTYMSQSASEDPKYAYELCRLKKREYQEGKTLCIYQRQSRGKNATITIDEPKAACQTQFQCKRQK